MMRTLVLAAVLAVAASGAACAEGRSEAPAIHLSLQGVDLSKTADVEKIYADLSQAARKVCDAGPHEVFTADEAERVDLCYRDTMNSAVAQSRSAQLHALHVKTSPLFAD